MARGGVRTHHFHIYATDERLIPSMELQRHLVDAGVEQDHGGEGDPEVADLQDAVEERVVHVLDVALAGGHRPVSDEVLPADDRREEHHHRHRPRHQDRTQHLPNK